MKKPLKNQETVCVPLDKIVDGDQIRLKNDEDSIRELAESIKTCGLLQPPGVKKIKGDKYMTVFGSRRIAAVRSLDWKEISVILITGKDPLVYTLVENLQRKDLTTQEQALTVKKLVDSEKWNQAQLAEMIGKNKSYISRMAKLGELIKAHFGEVPLTKLPPATICWELLDTPELLIPAADGNWSQQKARKKAKELKEPGEKRKSKAHSVVSSENDPAPATPPQPQYQDLSLYEPIRCFDGGFEIQRFLFTRDSGMDTEAVIEKMQELQNNLDSAIDILRQHQSQKADSERQESDQTIIDQMPMFGPHSDLNQGMM